MWRGVHRCWPHFAFVPACSCAYCNRKTHLATFSYSKSCFTSAVAFCKHKKSVSAGTFPWSAGSQHTAKCNEHQWQRVLYAVITGWGSSLLSLSFFKEMLGKIASSHWLCRVTGQKRSLPAGSTSWWLSKPIGWGFYSITSHTVICNSAVDMPPNQHTATLPEGLESSLTFALYMIV